MVLFCFFELVEQGFSVGEGVDFIPQDTSGNGEAFWVVTSGGCTGFW